jgi:hypothetical protein
VVISFKGLPPHDLGTAETGSAQAIGEFVEVTMNTLDSWHSPPGNLLRVQMSPAIARSLAERLAAAAVEAEANASGTNQKQEKR